MARVIAGAGILGCGGSLLVLLARSTGKDPAAMLVLAALVTAALVSEHLVLKHRRPRPLDFSQTIRSGESG
jgi:hypothetical protein